MSLITHDFNTSPDSSGNADASEKAAIVGCVIVTLNPKIDVFKRIVSTIAKQVDQVLIVDNDSNPYFIEWIKAKPINCKMLPMGRNIGVGAAQNQGIRYAQTQGCSHILLMDQDSLPSEDMVANLMLASLDLKRYRGQSVVVGPRIFDPRIGKDFPFVRFGRGFVKRGVCPEKRKSIKYIHTDFLIASGMLIPMDVIQQVGLMDEALFIDNVDLEWGFRAQQI